MTGRTPPFAVLCPGRSDLWLEGVFVRSPRSAM
ncbi:hypothetical protein OOU_Y34scaffold00308g37 [Pyricularia oryzae Y34]|uniref:Uncharacterized protein n=4 Tax=Pyricularia oryzae TaxID=318829 RepID=Q2KF24_PYRO7|nr:hypothetical protein MGCH7_ch7g862 [Pyricularia oryzae 70-15]ELQ41026.1 hypothetical protein OOU_Y34scaffold00308g37 [Pyricularia oryzae Y34]QBZ65613.1 hypothetical protein PoMZ_12575 [Pyricularia oryzae]